MYKWKNRIWSAPKPIENKSETRKVKVKSTYTRTIITPTEPKDIFFGEFSYTVRYVVLEDSKAKAKYYVTTTYEEAYEMMNKARVEQGYEPLPPYKRWEV